MRAAMRKREVIQPRKFERVEADVVLCAAGSSLHPLWQGCKGSIGVIERGEHTKYFKCTWEV